MQINNTFGVTPGDIGYDIETYPNIFTFTAKHTVTGFEWYFEISDRQHDGELLCHFLDVLRENGCRMVGYNNVGFDYPVCHFIYQLRNTVSCAPTIYEKAMAIINTSHNARFSNIVPEWDRIVPQVDLYLIHHFDNQAKATSLKMLEFNMRSKNIEDLPFDVGLMLTREQMDVLKTYNRHDVLETNKFYWESIEQIQFRAELSEKYDCDFTNFNDTKIGKQYFIMQLEEDSPGCCYNKSSGKKQVQQTIRESINLGDVVLPYIQFEHPEFQRILDWFKSKTITETKGSIKDLNCTIDGFTYVFGTGGIHGSVESQIIYSDDEYIIEDWDVASYYPNLAIANGLHPAHLGDTFCRIYAALYQQRAAIKKQMKTDEVKADPVLLNKLDCQQAMLKLALNGVYGDSGNKYSPFFDTQYTMSITINGQLSLCMLAEQLIKLGQLEMIQINTDGLTVRYPRQHKEWVHSVCSWWEGLTGLQLEDAEYSRFMVRDVNNYIAEYTNGKVKRKGAYEFDLGWHQNHSSLVVPMAANAALVDGADISEWITNHLQTDRLDFMRRTKVPRSSILEHGGQKVTNIVRYFISKDGERLEKVMPPKGPAGEYKRASKLTDAFFDSVMDEIGPGVWDERIHTKNKSKYEERRIGIDTGWNTTICNNLDSLDYTLMPATINLDYYIAEAEKLVNPLIH